VRQDLKRFRFQKMIGTALPRIGIYGEMCVRKGAEYYTDLEYNLLST